jgi:drug/metabolite transporter (DMT)-like permease
VNNEVGSVTDIAAVAALVRRLAPAALVHSDAVQAASWVDLRTLTPHVDLLSLSGHKFGGPKGIGVMVVRRINPWPPIRANRRTAVLTGLFWALGMGFFFESLSHTMVAYAMAAKCTHTIFIVVLGYLIFNEHDFRKRLSASALLVLGLCVLLLGN